MKPADSYYRSPLYQFIKKKFPEFERNNGTVDVYRMASEVGVSPEAIYLIFRNKKASSKQALMFCELSKKNDRKESEHLTLHDFVPFMGG